jgi:choline dehydrogenase-like flavoprotein
MHLLGTTRMGRKDDGESVADDVGRVWGLANLFLGGSSLFAHPTASNPVLTACALSVRSVDVISRKGEAIE